MNPLHIRLLAVLSSPASRPPAYMLAMEGKCRNMSRVRVYLTQFLPALHRIQKSPSSVTKRQRAIRFAADMCLARTANKGSTWTRALNLRLMHRKKTMMTMKMKGSPFRRSHSITPARRVRFAFLNSRYDNADLETESHDHDVGIDRRLGTLRRLVPGGRRLADDTLFQETADYVLNLQMQINAMEALADFYTTNSASRVDESVVKQQGLAASVAA